MCGLSEVALWWQHLWRGISPRAGWSHSPYGVMSIPTLIIFKDGKEAERMVGLQSRDVLAKKLDAYK